MVQNGGSAERFGDEQALTEKQINFASSQLVPNASFPASALDQLDQVLDWRPRAVLYTLALSLSSLENQRAPQNPKVPL